MSIRVEGFQGKKSTLRGPESFCKLPPRNIKRTRLAAFDEIRNVFSLKYV